MSVSMLDNPLIPLSDRLEIAKGAITFREQIIANREMEIKELKEQLELVSTQNGN